MSTFEWPIKFLSFMIIIVYLLSILTDNVSQVDKIWTFLPTIYVTYFALLPLWPNSPLFPLFPYVPIDVNVNLVSDYSPRALMILVLVVLWMVRLTYNTWRRGLFALSEEDYRWAVLRQRIPAWLFHITNFFFIAITQNIILFLLSLPTHTAIYQPHTPLTRTDIGLFVLALVVLATEFTADNQQYAYQTFKRAPGMERAARKQAERRGDWAGARMSWTEEDRKRGFVTRGLWAWSRHPNFACEQSFWIIISLIPYLSATPTTSPPTLLSHPYLAALPPLLARLPAPPLRILGYAPLVSALSPALVLCALFFSSTLFSESISQGKYPEAYRAYKRRVGMFLPVKAVLWWLLVGAGDRDGVVGGRKNE